MIGHRPGSMVFGLPPDPFLSVGGFAPSGGQRPNMERKTVVRGRKALSEGQKNPFRRGPEGTLSGLENLPVEGDDVVSRDLTRIARRADIFDGLVGKGENVVLGDAEFRQMLRDAHFAAEVFDFGAGCI